MLFAPKHLHGLESATKKIVLSFSEKSLPINLMPHNERDGNFHRTTNAHSLSAVTKIYNVYTQKAVFSTPLHSSERYHHHVVATLHDMYHTV